MTTFKITLEYDGTGYHGWQAQKNVTTVLGELREAVEKVFHANVEIQGAGRTDAGVHALAQVAHIKLDGSVRQSMDALRRQLNDLLPASIAVLDIERAPNTFHARHSARSRAYRYQITTRKQAFKKKYVWWIKEPLDTTAMNRAAALLIGRHDFVCFRAEDPSRFDDSTIVVVQSAAIEVSDDLILFRIEASHFIWRMVRRLVGVLVRIGKGELSDADMLQLLDGRCDGHKFDVAAWTAPASGLFLDYVRY
jgi:tRNA pseudouridine38-40 synthase